MLHEQYRRDHQPDGHHHVLKVVCEHNGDHPTQHGVQEHQGQDDGHCDLQLALLMHPHHAGDEDGVGLEEHPHVQDTRGGKDDRAGDPDALAEAHLVELGDGHHAVVTQRDDDEPCQPHNEASRRRKHRYGEGRESAGEAFLGRVHDCDQAQFSGDHRGYAKVRAHRPSGHHVVLHVADVAHRPHPQQGGDHQEDHSDAPVGIAEIGVQLQFREGIHEARTSARGTIARVARQSATRGVSLSGCGFLPAAHKRSQG